jgi:hypothetical protein
VTFELTVTLQLKSDTLYGAVEIVERRLKRDGIPDGAGVALSAVTGKIVPARKGDPA